MASKHEGAESGEAPPEIEELIFEEDASDGLTNDPPDELELLLDEGEPLLPEGDAPEVAPFDLHVETESPDEEAVGAGESGIEEELLLEEEVASPPEPESPLVPADESSEVAESGARSDRGGNWPAENPRQSRSQKRSPSRRPPRRGRLPKPPNRFRRLAKTKCRCSI